MRKKASSTLGSVSSRAKLKQRREPYWQPIVRGCALGYRRGATGGSWIARVRTDDARQAYHALGPADDLNDGNGLTYEAALEQARKHFQLPGGASSRHTVGAVLDRYLEGLRASNPQSTVADAEARINAILKPEFGDLPLTKLRADRITRWRDGLAKDRKPDTVNRLLTILKAALNRAWREDRLIADDTAWRMVGRVDGGGEARKIFLTAAQARVLVAACAGAALKRLVQAALLTGARSGELAALRVHDFDNSTGTLEIRDGKTGGRTVYLSQEACGFFAGICAGHAPKALLLARDDGEAWGKNHHQKPFAAAVQTSGLPDETTLYALRHTHISLALLAGVNIQVLAENCGTSVRMIELHYGKFLRADRRAMFDKVQGLVPATG
jgi:integrase